MRGEECMVGNGVGRGGEDWKWVAGNRLRRGRKAGRVAENHLRWGWLGMGIAGNGLGKGDEGFAGGGESEDRIFYFFFFKNIYLIILGFKK